jgi:hypothetical protein
VRGFFEGFWKAGEFGAGAVGTPDDAAVFEDAEDGAGCGASEGLDAVAGLEGGGFAEGLDGGNHRVAVEDAGDVVGDGGGEFAAADGGEVGEERVASASSNVSEGVSVEKEKRRGLMKMPQETQNLQKGGVC